MSWQTYVDTNLVGTGKVAAAAIIGLDGNVWAISKNFQVSAAEGKKIAGAFANPNDIIANGLWLNNQKYFALRYDDRSLYGKKGSSGCVCVKTKQAVLCATYPENVQPGEANMIVERLGDYLVSVGY